MTSQNTIILNHLINRGPLTPIEALKKYGCMRLAARINQLRDKGHNIKTTIVSSGKKHFALYSYVDGNI
jgi:hypothetical protein